MPVFIKKLLVKGSSERGCSFIWLFVGNNSLEIQLLKN